MYVMENMFNVCANNAGPVNRVWESYLECLLDILILYIDDSFLEHWQDLREVSDTYFALTCCD